MPKATQILVIDDDPLVRKTTKQLLETLDCDVTLAGGGEEGLEMCRRNHPDIVLLDQMMPGMNGAQVLEKIRSDPEIADVYVIFSSSSRTASEDQSKGLEAGADGYITRPCPAREFVARVHSAIRHTKEIESQHLQEKQESLGLMAGGFAHNINNILMAILSNAEAGLLQISDNHPVRQNLDEIRTSVMKATSLGHNMLNYIGQIGYDKQSLDIRELIEETVDLCPMLSGEQVSINNLDPIENHRIAGNRDQLRQALLAILVNAAEASKETSGQIQIEAAMISSDPKADGINEDEYSNNERISIRVTDNGHGISRKDLARIFDPFFTTKFPGRGLGLSAAKGIIRGHGGNIKVASTEGKGSTFEMILPVFKIPAESATPQSDGIHSAIRRTINSPPK